MRGYAEVALIACLWLGGCRDAPPPAEEPMAEEIVRITAPPPTPEELFGGLEERMLSSRSVALDFRIVAEGAVSARLQGQLAVTPDGHAQLTAFGTFAGRGVDVVLEAEGGIMEYGPSAADEPREGPVPSGLGEALMIGFSRMGVLHNVSRLVGNTVPDQANGGVQRWVTVEALRPAGDAGVAFEVVVAGQPSGTATLEFDEEGRPVLRRQSVSFADGETTVEEIYENVTIGR